MILNVAEKPSVAKEISQILSSSRFTSRRTESQYNPVHMFEMDFRGSRVQMAFTSVTGHVMNCAFPKRYHNWKSVDPIVLLKGYKIRINMIYEIEV
jgi:DNA topoisomerase-3